MASVVYRQSVGLACALAVTLALLPGSMSYVEARGLPSCGDVNVAPTPGTTPILFVHGINEDPTIWTGKNGAGNVEGTTTPPLTYIQDRLGTSMVQGYTFNWSDSAGPANPVNWVTDPPSPDLGAQLAATISCVARAAGHKVIVVAHSMGGLIAEDASTIDLQDIAAVFTLGTPYHGSWLASAAVGQDPDWISNLFVQTLSAYCLLPFPIQGKGPTKQHTKPSGAIDKLCQYFHERDDPGVEGMRLNGGSAGGWRHLHPEKGIPWYRLSAGIRGFWQPLWPLNIQEPLSGTGDGAVDTGSQSASVPSQSAGIPTPTASCPVTLRTDLPPDLSSDLTFFGALEALSCFHTNEPTNRVLLDSIIRTIQKQHMLPTVAVPPPSNRPTPQPDASPVTVPPAPKAITVHVTVPANAGWVDTGLHVSPGNMVDIRASGSWTPDGGADYTGPQGFGYSPEWPDNYFNLADLGACADCASTPYPFWGELISYTGSSPPEPGSYTSTAVASQARLIDGVGSSFARPWPYSGELWLASTTMHTAATRQTTMAK